MRSLCFLCTMMITMGTACNPLSVHTQVSSTNPADTAWVTASAATSSEVMPSPTNTSATVIPDETTQTFTPAPTNTPTLSPTIPARKTPTQTLTPSLTPTYAILRGIVLEQSNCRYGPGAAYLYKYGLYKDNTLEIIGRNETGTWILVQAIGGNNPCWLKASLMNVRGDVMTLAPGSLHLPESPYYGPVTGVASVRNGEIVIISWNPLILRAGDDSEQYPYLIEAWVCRAGQLIFVPIGSWATSVDVRDEPGCSEPSHARLYGVEKHGYTAWVTIPWTQP
jgi:hypothetical protein